VAEKMLTLREAVARIGDDAISERTLRRAIADREIPGVKIRSVYLVNAAWVDTVTSWVPDGDAA
jgi:hypothetical protein